MELESRSHPSYPQPFLATRLPAPPGWWDWFCNVAECGHFLRTKSIQSNPPDIKVYLLYNIRGMGLLNYSVILLQWRPWLVDFLAIILNMSNNSWSQFFRACHEMSAPVHPFFARGCIESQCPCPWRRWHDARVLCLSIKVCTAQLNTFDYVWHSIYN